MIDPLEQTHHIKWVAIASGILGMLGAAACIVAYFVQRNDAQKREQQQQISLNMPPPRTQRMQGLLQGYLTQLMWLNVADFLTGLSFAMGMGSSYNGYAGHLNGVSPDTLCRAQSILVAITPLFSAAWTLALAIELWRITFRLEQDLAGNFQRRRYIAYQVLCWGVPVILLLGTLFLTGVDSPHRPGPQDTGSWCWLDVKENTTDEGVYDPVWPLYVPKLAIALLLVGLYTAVVCRVRCATNYLQVGGAAPGMQGGGKWNALLLHFAAYPLVFSITVLPPLLLRTSLGETHAIQRTVDGKEEHGVVTYGWLAYMTAILLPAQGTFNLCLFASSNRQVRFALRRLWCCGPVPCSCHRRRLSRDRRQPSSSGAQLTEQGQLKTDWLLGSAKSNVAGIGAHRGDRNVSLFGSTELDRAQEELASALLPSDDEGGQGGGSHDYYSSDEEQSSGRRGGFGGARSSSVNVGPSGGHHGRQTSVQYGDAAAAEGDSSFVWEQGNSQPTHTWAASSGGLQGLPPSLEAAMVAYGRDSADSFDLPLPNTMTDGSVFDSVYDHQ